MKRSSRTTVGLAIFSAVMLIAFAATTRAVTPPGLDLGSDKNFAFIDLGASTLGWNSGPVAGNVLLGLGVHAGLSGGNNGGLSNGGVLFKDSSAVVTGALQNPISQTLVADSVTQDAKTIAQNVSTFASSLAPTQTFTNINSTTTITGNGGLNVIDVANIQNATLTLAGGPNDFFLFNVTGAVNTNHVMNIGGLSPEQILFNLTGTGTVFQTSGGDKSYGTYLAANGGRFQFSNLDLTGRLINIGGDVQLVSGSSIPVVPEPGTFSLIAFGGFAMAGALKRLKSR